MALKDMIAEIVTILGTVAGIGQAHSYWRYAASEAEQKELYVKAGTGILNVCFVTREATRSVDLTAGASSKHDRHQIAIECFRAMTDDTDSEQKLQDLVEAIRDKLQLAASRKLPNAAGFLRTPVQVEIFNAVMLANKLCWHAKLTVPVEDKLLGS